MSKREKTAWVLVILSWLIVGSYFFVERGRAHERAIENERLKTEKESLDKVVAQLKEDNAKLTLTTSELNDNLSDANSVIAELKKRPEPRPVEVVRWRELPVDCQLCMENNSLPVEVVDDNEWVRTHVRDAFHPEDGASIEFLENFDRDVLAPAKEQVKKCESTLDECQGLLGEATAPRPEVPESPVSFVSHHGFFVGTGYIGDDNLGIGVNYEGRFIRLGSRDGINVELGINVGGFTPYDGRDVDIYGLAGGEIKW